MRRTPALSAALSRPEGQVHRPAARDQWFWDHFEQAAGEIVGFLGEDGLSIAGRRVADVGSGDGIIDLGLCTAASPAELVGFDLNLTDRSILAAVAEREGVGGQLPESLVFAQSTPNRIPADDGSFDVVISWSAFEHIGDLKGMSEEVRRIVRPDGVVFIQVWPLFFSQHGSHLMEWFPEGFPHLMTDDDEIERVLRESAADPSWVDYMFGEYRHLNRAHLDDIGEALRDSGLDVVKLELIAEGIHIPAGLAQRHTLSELATSGFKLLAIPR